MTAFVSQLVPATLEDYPVVQNLARFYAYDMSRFCGQAPGWEFPQDGLYTAHDLKRYFNEKDRYPFLIRVQNELAGFVMVNKVGSDDKADWNMGEFFVIAKFQGKGIGEKIATEVFSIYQGVWDVMAIPENTPARHFWRKIITKYTHGHFAEQLKMITTQTVPFPMIVFRFESKAK